MNVIACNDDYYDDYTSRITAVPVSGGVNHFIVVDGYSAHHGDYQIVVEQYQPCELDCLPGSVLEEEPPLVDGYLDEYNGGCTVFSQLGFAPTQTLDVGLFCGASGWYQSDGEMKRDIDWFVATIPPEGVIEIQVTAELWLHMWQISHDGCDNIVHEQYGDFRPCLEGTFSVFGEPGETVEIVFGPFESAPPAYHLGNEFRYVLITNLEPSVQFESRSWSDLKAMYR